MKRLIYSSLALIGLVLSSIGFAYENAQKTSITAVDNSKSSEIVYKKKIKPFVYSDILMNNNTVLLAGHYSHASHYSHSSHYSHASHISGY